MEKLGYKAVKRLPPVTQDDQWQSQDFNPCIQALICAFIQGFGYKTGFVKPYKICCMKL